MKESQRSEHFTVELQHTWGTQTAEPVPLRYPSQGSPSASSGFRQPASSESAQNSLPIMGQLKNSTNRNKLKKWIEKLDCVPIYSIQKHIKCRGRERMVKHFFTLFHHASCNWNRHDLYGHIPLRACNACTEKTLTIFGFSEWWIWESLLRFWK